MSRRSRSTVRAMVLVALGTMAAASGFAAADAKTDPLRAHLDSPILFTKRGNYQGIHIYDTCYQWHPGGGIYVLENPSDPPEEHRVRVVIDANSKNSLGKGMYFDPDLSYDAKKVLFCYKGEPSGSSSIYEIHLDGTGLRRITNPRTAYLPCGPDGKIKSVYCGRHGSLGAAQDLTPAYLPDGRIVFTTMRHNGLVPCNNTGVAILHVMDADGTNTHPISVNSETEFDPSLMVDGRILYGRWEYVDKTALTIQSLWTVFPDGTLETALFANNMVFPEAVLDSRQVFSDPDYVVSTFSKHNSTPRGAIGLIDTRMGKNDPNAVFNFSDPGHPTRDTGEACEPFPITKNLILFSDRHGRKNALFLIRRNPDDSVTRELLFSDPSIDCHTPIPIKPRPIPAMRRTTVDRSKDYGFFLVQDVYEGMPNVPRGSVKRLRVVEETSRVSKTPGGGPFNQTFTISAALAWTAKNYLGEVQVEADGSAYFQVPAGKMIFLQALDAEGRCVRSMRTFIQAAPGATRSCIGCHEDKKASYVRTNTAMAERKDPQKLQDESWGSGVLDYPGMVQPILNKHCAKCHGGEKGFAAGLDLTGGWTEYFNNSYHNLVSRREVQYKATLIAGVCSMNGTSYYSAQIFAPYAIGSPAAPLGKVLVDGALGHKDRFTMPRAERDLVLAWIDANGPYHGTWNYTPRAFQLTQWRATMGKLVAEMSAAGCVTCHTVRGRGARFEQDWFNLERPELSRILRAPLAKGQGGFGEALCRDRKVDGRFRRLRIFSTGRYEHAVKPLASFPKQTWRTWDKGPASGKPVVTFADTTNPHYQKMLAIIRAGRAAALANPRLDMPGGEQRAIAGHHRNIYPVRIPEKLPPITARQLPSGVVEIRWGLTTHTWGLNASVYRGEKPDFALTDDKRIARTQLGAFFDDAPLAAGTYYYAVRFDNGEKQSKPVRLRVAVTPPPPPAAPGDLTLTPAPGEIALTWPEPGQPGLRYHVYRTAPGQAEPKQLTAEPIGGLVFVDRPLPAKQSYTYVVRAVGQRGQVGPPSKPATGAAMAMVKTPMFSAPLSADLTGRLHGGKALAGQAHGKAKIASGVLDLTGGGHVTFAKHPSFDLASGFTAECWVRLAKPTQMPVILSCGRWNAAGWFLQALGGRWRWHLGGVDCDGGKVAVGQWIYLAGTFDGRTAELYVNGKRVARVTRTPNLAPWRGPMVVGQYSSPAASYQVLGQIARVQTYRRALTAAEAAEHAAAPPK